MSYTNLTHKIDIRPSDLTFPILSQILRRQSKIDEISPYIFAPIAPFVFHRALIRYRPIVAMVITLLVYPLIKNAIDSGLYLKSDLEAARLIENGLERANRYYSLQENIILNTPNIVEAGIDILEPFFLFRRFFLNYFQK